ncbi:hypothetical protein B0H66DRAFT_215469 [Apodospora peruviana]|uniref:Uncharacterized protein n=1 Tax=Apodospora peruviana TaxID=516989 RepID=A0AAE0M839_9PEZI|nr:hypothetical protein B0H66DRAFT_215469 [Apodospora peruviana]
MFPLHRVRCCVLLRVRNMCCVLFNPKAQVRLCALCESGTFSWSTVDSETGNPLDGYNFWVCPRSPPPRLRRGERCTLTRPTPFESIPRLPMEIFRALEGWVPGAVTYLGHVLPADRVAVKVDRILFCRVVRPWDTEASRLPIVRSTSGHCISPPFTSPSPISLSRFRGLRAANGWLVCCRTSSAKNVCDELPASLHAVDGRWQPKSRHHRIEERRGTGTGVLVE